MDKSKASGPLSEITAEREGRKQVFKKAVWDLLGPTKNGWKEVTADPPELQGKNPEQTTEGALKGLGVNAAITADNVFHYIKSVSMYLHSISLEERAHLFELMDQDEDLKKLDVDDTFRVEDNEDLKDPTTTPAPATGTEETPAKNTTKKKGGVINKLKADQTTPAPATDEAPEKPLLTQLEGETDEEFSKRVASQEGSQGE